jgi:hypothetical protein
MASAFTSLVQCGLHAVRAGHILDQKLGSICIASALTFVRTFHPNETQLSLGGAELSLGRAAANTFDAGFSLSRIGKAMNSDNRKQFPARVLPLIASVLFTVGIMLRGFFIHRRLSLTPGAVVTFSL